MSKRFIFSGHETFPCRNLWLKKGYDFVANDGNFNASDAVVAMGVGKNMVNSIRFWLRAFGMTVEDQPTDIAQHIFEDNGWDPYCEDELTLWLLHYKLVTTNEASLYKIVFQDYQRRNREFDKQQLQNYVEALCKSEGYDVNRGTLTKDINILLQNYVYPENLTDPEKCSNLLMGLRMLRYLGKEERINEKNAEIYGFAEVNHDYIPREIVLYALIDQSKQAKTLSNDVLSDIALTFCMSLSSLGKVIGQLVELYPGVITYSDNSGIRNVHFSENVEPCDVLDIYYRK